MKQGYLRSSMKDPKNIFAIIGSASDRSANQKLVEYIAALTKDQLQFKIFNELKTLPHFDPVLSTDNTPAIITTFRNEIEKADAILICTPEYVFSIPSGLKNAIEWCVATTVFSDKPIGIITASAHGVKAHEELQLIMKTVMTKFTNDTTLLIQGIKGKIDDAGNITNEQTKQEVNDFVAAFRNLIDDK
jgi:chromate reductase, NAD(P)H dehydrogenase (quinone)